MMRETFADTTRRDPKSLAYEIELMANPWSFAVEDIANTPIDCWHGGADSTFSLNKLRPLVARIPNLREFSCQRKLTCSSTVIGTPSLGIYSILKA
jgi:hypothetical protein